MKLKPDRSILFCLMLSAIMLTQSCISEYGAGNPFTEKAFVPKIASTDNQSAIFAGGSYATTKKNDSLFYGSKNFNTSYQCHLGKLYVFNPIQIAAVAFANKGNFVTDDITGYEGGKEYYGGGLAGEFTVYFSIKDYVYWFFSTKYTFNYETGEFLEFRKKAAQDSLITNICPKPWFNSLNSELSALVKFKEHSINFNLASAMIIYATKPSLTTSFGFSYSYSNLTLFAKETFYNNPLFIYLPTGRLFWFGINYTF